MPYYHGTSTAIHASDTPYLDIERSRNAAGIIKKDMDDPSEPHIYFSDNYLTSCLFALATNSARHFANGNFHGQAAFILFDKKPDFKSYGHLYTLSENEIPGGLEKRVPGKFVTYANVPLSAKQHSIITPESVFAAHDVQVYYLDPRSSPQTFSPGFTDACRNGGAQATMQFITDAQSRALLHRYDTGVARRTINKNDRAFGAAVFKF